MKKLNHFITKYLLFSFPAVFSMFVWEFFQNQEAVLNNNNKFIYIIWEILSLHLIIWFILLIYTLLLLIISSNFREKFLVKLAGIKDRDERESVIIGKSSRFTFFSTLALLVFLLFFSTINISIIKLPVEKTINGKQNALSIGLSFNIFEKKVINNRQNGNVTKFSTQQFPLSKQSMLILLILWHLGTFHYLSKKIQLRE